jgi:phage terminase large subunit-like protein
MKTLGRTEARLHTQPLRPLTPETSLGFEVIDFARDVCGIDLLPWQAWLLVRMLELNEDGTFRFRRVVVLVGRQNGKTTLLKVLSLWVMTRATGRTVLGVAQDLSIAKESWSGAVEIAEDYWGGDPWPKVKRSTGDLELKLENRSRYRIAAANGRSGRGLPVNLLVLDELREMKTWEPYQALAPTISAQSDGMIVCISNAGEADSVVLNGLRDVALAGEDGVGLFEWSAPDSCELDDVEAWAQANPGLGRTVQESELRVAMATFPPAQFRTEHLCQRVDNIDQPIDLQAWQACGDSAASLDAYRERVVLCLDVAPDNSHVTLVAAAKGDDGRIRVEPVQAWDSTQAARKDLPALIERIKPVKVGYFQNALAADMKAIPRTEQIKTTDLAPLSVGFAELVTSRQIIHGNDPLLNKHVGQASRMRSGDQWKFCRTHAGAVIDCLYAAAGAAHLARTAVPSKGKPRIIVAA